MLGIVGLAICAAAGALIAHLSGWKGVLVLMLGMIGHIIYQASL
jgi:uncharacterized membrane protein